MRRTSMLRPIINGLLVSALVMLALAVNVALAEQPDKKGLSGATESKDTGEPTDLDGNSVANDFGTVTSQLGTTEQSVGEHSSGFAPGQDPDAEPAQRLGVGNVARTDDCVDDINNCDATVDGTSNSLTDVINRFDLDPSGDVVDSGGRPGNHAALIDGIDGNDFTDVNEDPGLPEDCRDPAQQRTGDCVAT